MQMAGSKHEKRRTVIHYMFKRYYLQGCSHPPGIVLPLIKSAIKLLKIKASRFITFFELYSLIKFAFYMLSLLLE